jgi:hypothetical protein
MTDEEPLYGLYDRQIRLFGQNTQSLIESAQVYVVEDEEAEVRRTDIGGEIMKNLVLLGVGKLTVSPSTERSYRRMVPKSVTEINPNIRFKVGEFESHGGDVPDLVVMIDTGTSYPCRSSVYVCSKCMSFNDGKAEHVCGDAGLSDGFFINDCLLGAILVQEWVKRLQGRRFVECYRLRM